ncbi:immunoglobulin E-set, partial [Pavlovales sp. CCMP2436]
SSPSSPGARQRPAGPPRPGACSAVGMATQRALAGEVMRFAVQARDESGKRRASGGDDFVTTIVRRFGDSGRTETLTVEMVDCADGTYLGTYCPMHAGAHELRVLLRGEHVRGSPYAVEVAPAAEEAPLAELTDAYLLASPPPPPLSSMHGRTSAGLQLTSSGARARVATGVAVSLMPDKLELRPMPRVL